MATAAAEVAEKRTLVEVDTSDVSPIPGMNPRHRFDQVALDELQASIAEEGGNLIPALVTDWPEGKSGDTDLVLVYGERRWRASTAAGTKLLAIYQPGLTYARIIKLAGIENLKRVDLSAIERAHWYLLMMDEGDTTQEEIADLEGVDQSTVSNTLRLLELPEEITDLVDEGKLAPTNARDLLLPWMKEEEKVREKFFRIVAQQLDFGATTGQHMSKPWLKEMVERVGKIAKPAPEPKPAPKPEPKKAAAPAEKEAPKQESKTAAAPVAEEKAEAGEAPGKAEPEETPPAEAAPAPAAEEKPAPAPAPPAEPIEVDLDAGVFAAATQVVGGEHHHLTFAVMPHANRPGAFSVIVGPKSRGGMPSIASESAIGTAENIEDEVRAALGRLVEKINDGRK